MPRILHDVGGTINDRTALRDPAYDGDVPFENEEDFRRALEGHAHIAEEIRYPGDSNRYYRCAKCGEPMYEVPRGVGEYVGG